MRHMGGIPELNPVVFIWLFRENDQSFGDNIHNDYRDDWMRMRSQSMKSNAPLGHLRRSNASNLN